MKVTEPVLFQSQNGLILTYLEDEMSAENLFQSQNGLILTFGRATFPVLLNKFQSQNGLILTVYLVLL